MYHSDKRCHITVTSNLQLSGTAKVCFLLILCSSPVGKKPAHHTPLGIQSNRKSPSWKLLIRAPEGKVSCEGPAASYCICPQIDKTSVLPPVHWPAPFTCPYPAARMQKVLPHIFWKRGKPELLGHLHEWLRCIQGSKTRIVMEGKYHVFPEKKQPGILERVLDLESRDKDPIPGVGTCLLCDPQYATPPWASNIYIFWIIIKYIYNNSIYNICYIYLSHTHIGP